MPAPDAEMAVVNESRLIFAWLINYVSSERIQ